MNRIVKAGELLYGWLSNFAKTYKNLLPTAEQIVYPYLYFTGAYNNVAEAFNLPIKIYNNNATSTRTLLLLAGDIEEAVGEGIVIGDAEMGIKIEKGSPFYQDMESGVETITAGYINLTVTIY